MEYPVDTAVYPGGATQDVRYSSTVMEMNSQGEGERFAEKRDVGNERPQQRITDTTQIPRNVCLVEVSEYSSENVGNVKFVEELSIMKCNIEGLDVDVILDSGAEISIIDDTRVKSMRDVEIMSTSLDVRDAQREKIKLMGKCVRRVQMGDWNGLIGFYVTEKERDKVIMGLPAISSIVQRRVKRKRRKKGTLEIRSDGITQNGRHTHDQSGQRIKEAEEKIEKKIYTDEDISTERGGDVPGDGTGRNSASESNGRKDTPLFP